ncbi:succinylglutamate desuccinylase/aspartoacylase family protein [Niveispirillum sp. KHB5.9]|uniref:succinylglutamate desuccinylase/aspartoacylase family protein n=1 Tax=Niveispirillum sp. KHB5.9 TaxID=3400269 RepID=UPI003A872196
MTHQTDTITLPHGRPGTTRRLTIHRFGTQGARPKAYIQAGLHAGELPGLVVARHLLERLTALDAEGRIKGEVVLVPMANPIGLDQVLLGGHVGRFDLATGVNFNRAFADLADAVSVRLRPGDLGPDASANGRFIQAALANAAQALQPRTEADALRKLLLSHAVDADIVLDLHCDSEAVMHLYTTPACWPLGVADLASRLEAKAVFLADVSGGEPFDEVCSTPWDTLRARHGGPETPVPVGCSAVTVELRGEGDVDDTLAAADAAALIDHLAWRGIIDMPAPLVPDTSDLATPLAGVDRVRAPVAGVALYHVALGDMVTAGRHVATVLDPFTGDRHACHAVSDGIIWSRTQNRYAGPGDILLCVAGREVLVTSGPLLTA